MYGKRERDIPYLYKKKNPGCIYLYAGDISLTIHLSGIDRNSEVCDIITK